MQKFIMLVGLPGSGKSTYAKELKKNWEEVFNHITSCHSSDSIRKELYGDENIQGNAQEVFSLMQNRTIQDLKDGVSVVIYDATNIRRKDRKEILRRVKSLKKDIRCECHIVWARFETCIDRNNNRERVVPEEVIWRMAKQFHTPWYDEGWNDIKIMLKDKEYHYDELLLSISHDNPHHKNDSIKDHMERVKKECLAKMYAPETEDDKFYDETEAKEAIFLSIVHDIGKIYTKEFRNSKGEPTEEAHYYQHQNVGAYMALGLDILSNGKFTLKVSYLTLLHMEPFFDKQPSNYWKNEVDPEIKKLIYLFNECDRKGA